MTAEEEAGWRQVKVMITSSPSQDTSTTQPETEEPIRDQPTSPVPAAVAPLLPEAQEEPTQPTLQDKALIDKQAEEHEECEVCVCVRASPSLSKSGRLSLALPDAHTAALQPQTDTRRHVNRRTQRSPMLTHRLPAVLRCALLCCAGL